MPKLEVPSDVATKDAIRIKMRLLTHKPGAVKAMALDSLPDDKLIEAYYLIKRGLAAHKIATIVQSDWHYLTDINAGSLAQSILRLRHTLFTEDTGVDLSKKEQELLATEVYTEPKTESKTPDMATIPANNDEDTITPPPEFDVISHQETLIDEIKEDLAFWKAKAKTDQTEHIFKHVRALTDQLQKALQEHVKLQKQLSELPKEQDENDPFVGLGQGLFARDDVDDDSDNPSDPNDPSDTSPPATMTPHTAPQNELHDEIFGHTQNHTERPGNPIDAPDSGEPATEQEGTEPIQ